MLLLDTNVAIALSKGYPSNVRPRLNRARALRERMAISAIAAFELWAGVFRSQHRSENTARIQTLLSAFEILAFDAEDAVTAAEIRAHLAAAGKPIGPYDLLIAAQALRHDATLVTANTSELSRIPHLRLENWEGNNGGITVAGTPRRAG